MNLYISVFAFTYCIFSFAESESKVEKLNFFHGEFFVIVYVGEFSPFKRKLESNRTILTKHLDSLCPTLQRYINTTKNSVSNFEFDHFSSCISFNHIIICLLLLYIIVYFYYTLLFTFIMYYVFFYYIFIFIIYRVYIYIMFVMLVYLRLCMLLRCILFHGEFFVFVTILTSNFDYLHETLHEYILSLSKKLITTKSTTEKTQNRYSFEFDQFFPSCISFNHIF